MWESKNNAKKVLILSYSDLAMDPRVHRQIICLKDNYKVIAAGIGDPHILGVKYIDLKPRTVKSTEIKLFKKLTRAGIKAWNYFEIRARKGLGIYSHENYYAKKLIRMMNFSGLAGIKPDLIIANDIYALIVAFKLYDDSKVIFDAHEYSPEEYDSGYSDWDNFEKPARIYFCKKLLPKLCGFSTVCQGIADKYMKEFGVKAVVITNAPSFQDISPAILTEKIRIITHGIAAPIRKMELMGDMVQLLDDRFELYFMLIDGDPDYVSKLKERYKNNIRIKFLDPVPMKEIAAFTSQFDIGLFILEPVVFNYKFVLPNKFFEFIQARLAIAIGPSPEMQTFVEKYELGIVSKDFTSASMAEKINKLSVEEITIFKQNSNKVAKLLSAETNAELINELVENSF